MRTDTRAHMQTAKRFTNAKGKKQEVKNYET